MKILFVSNQGGQPVVDLKIAFARALLKRDGSATADLAVLRSEEAQYASREEPRLGKVWCFEESRSSVDFDLDAEIARITKTYMTSWWQILASERTFIDSSMLLGGAGERRESRRYAERLAVDFIRFFELVFSGRYDLVVAQTADSFMTYVLYRMAAEIGVPVRGISPGWLSEGGMPGGFLTEDEFLRAPAMRRAYRELRQRSLTEEERARVSKFRKDIVEFDGNKAFYKTSGKSFGRSAVSPNIRTLFAYMKMNAARRPEVDYFKIDPWAKLKANMKRIVRKRMAGRWLGRRTTEGIPPDSVFFPIHFQPEASTLVGGIFYANQIGLIEAIAKSLPLGSTLVLKEHPSGRGTRPVWQYRYLSHYPNVMFCDAPSKEIVRACDAVVTITGTIAIEAMALDRPVIYFGDWFYDHYEILYPCKSFNALPGLLRRLLVEREYERRTDKEDLVNAALLAHLKGLIPAFPRISEADIYISSILDELRHIEAAKGRPLAE